MTVPLLILALLLLTSAATFLTARYRPYLAPGVALTGSVLALLLWLATWFQLPFALGSAGDAPALIVDSEAWQVTLLLLVLLISALVAGLGRNSASAGVSAGAALLLVSAGIGSLWTASLSQLLSAWVLLALVWTLSLAIVLKARLWELLSILALAWTGVFFIALGAANLAQVGPGSLTAGAHWSNTALFWTALGASWQLLALPIMATRRNKAEAAPTGLTGLLYATPATTGGFLLFRLTEGGAPGQGVLLLPALAALAVFIWALHRAWTEMQFAGKQETALCMALAALVVAAATGAVVLPALRLLLLAGGVFLLAPMLSARSSQTGGRPGRISLLLGPALALAAMATLPLTIGFAALSALYDAWIEDGLWPLVPVISLLFMPLIAAGISFVWSNQAATEESVEAGNGARWRPLSRLALIIPALFLLTPAGLTTAGLWSWLTILLSIGGGLVLFRFRSRAGEMHTAATAAISRRSLPPWPGDLLRRGLSQGVLLVQQAAAILEGEWGLLWLLLLFAILLLLR